MRKVSDNQKRLLGFGSVALLLMAMAFFLGASLSSRKEAQRWNIHTYAVISEIDGLIENTLVATRRTRRFTLSRDENNRRAAYQSLRTLDQRLARLRHKTRDNSQQRVALRSIIAVSSQLKRDLSAVLVQGARLPVAQVNPVDRASTQRNIEAMLTTLQRMKSVERNLLMRREVREAAAQRQSDVWLGATVLGLGLFLVAMVAQTLRDSKLLTGKNAQLQKEIVEREEAQQALRASHQGLEERVGRRTHDLERLNNGLLAQIAEREQAEKALRTSEGRYHSLVATTSQVIWTTTAEGQVEDMPMWRDLTGQSVEQVAGYGWLDALHPDDKGKAAQAWLEAVERKGFYQVEFRIRRHDGAYRHFVSRGIPVMESGKVVEWVGTCTDIEDEKRAEEALRRAHEELEERVRERTLELAETNEALQQEISERLHIAEALRRSEEEYRLIIENSNDLIFKTDERGHFVFFNARMMLATGFSEEEIRGRHFTTLVHPEHRRAAMRFYLKQLHGGIADTYHEFPAATKSGAAMWVGQNVHLLKKADGTFTFQGAARDITERIEAQAEVRESEERFKRLADGTFEAVAVTVGEYVGDANNKFLEMFGYNMEEVRTMRAIDFITPETRSRVLEALSTNREEPYEATGLRADGSEMFLEICGKSIPYHGGAARITALRDITQRKEVERMKSEFVSTVSHELRTPLTSIRGALGLMVGGAAGVLPERAASMAQIALNNSERLIRLINDILDIEKIESGKMVLQLSPLDLRESVKAAVEANKSYGEELGVVFKLRVESASTREAARVDESASADESASTRTQDSLAAQDLFDGFGVCADGDRLAQVLTNLLGNAAKFSSHGKEGAVQVEVSVERVTNTTREYSQGAPSLSSQSSDSQYSSDVSYLRVSLRDEGSGIASEFRERLFGKFAQGDSSDTRQKGGTGLGLSISKAIVEKLDGRIGFYNNSEREEGAKGATFFFELPRYTSESVEEAPEPAVRVLASEKRRILVCEDDAEVAALLRLMLEQCGFSVDVARHAEEAKEKLLITRYSGMTLDLMLPDQDGISLLRELRDDPMTRDLPVIVVSAKAHLGRGEIKGDAVGVVDWLEKPIDARRLVSAVQRAASQTQSAQRPRILHVEDDADLIQIVESILGGIADISHTSTVQETHACLKREEFSVILLDMNLPDGSGTEIIEMIGKEVPPVPIVVFSAADVDRDLAGQIAGVLVKSRTSNQELLSTLTAILKQNGIVPESAGE